MKGGPDQFAGYQDQFCGYPGGLSNYHCLHVALIKTFVLSAASRSSHWGFFCLSEH